MMTCLDTLPLWAIGLLIFGLRVVDVSLGTIRTIAVVQGWIRLSVILGFFEVLIWLAAASQVITKIEVYPVLMLAFAGGYAAGNAAGIALERLLALGTCVMHIIASSQSGSAMTEALRARGQRVTTFEGQGRDAVRTMVYVTCPRRDVPQILRIVRAIDPSVFYGVERSTDSSPVLSLPRSATGLRSLWIRHRA